MSTDAEIAAWHPSEPERHHGQLRFAERFVHAYAGRFLHVHGIGWHGWDGARWAECLDGKERRAVVRLLKAALAEMPNLGVDERKMLLRDVAKIETAAGMAGMLELASALHPCTVVATELDAQPQLLNTKNGTLNLEHGTVSESSPSDNLSKVTTARFDPNARSDVFNDFLAEIQPDPEMRAFLARSLGSSLLGAVREHVLLIWYGRGANGKGTLRDAVAHALGDYAIEVPAELLLLSRHASNQAPERMRLKGARLAFCSEIADGAKLDEATMKKLTGGDPVNAKLLYRNPIQFDPSHILVMLTNHLPKVRGDDPATWRRIMAVPFDQIVPEGRRDGTLPERLKAAPDAVLAWLWAGWQDYQRHGLNPPEAVLAATRRYRQDSDTITRFIDDDDVVCNGHGEVRSNVLYQAFRDWSRRQGEPAEMTHKAFTEALDARDYNRKRTNRGAKWQGISLVADDDGAASWGQD